MGIHFAEKLNSSLMHRQVTNRAFNFPTCIPPSLQGFLEIICRSCTCVHWNSKCGQLFHNCPSGKTLPKLNKLNSQVNSNRREKPKRSTKTTTLWKCWILWESSKAKEAMRPENLTLHRRQCAQREKTHRYTYGNQKTDLLHLSRLHLKLTAKSPVWTLWMMIRTVSTFNCTVAVWTLQKSTQSVSTFNSTNAVYIVNADTKCQYLQLDHVWQWSIAITCNSEQRESEVSHKNC